VRGYWCRCVGLCRVFRKIPYKDVPGEASGKGYITLHSYTPWPSYVVRAPTQAKEGHP